MAELRVTGKTKFAILEYKKFLEHLFLSRQSIAASLVCDFFFKSHLLKSDEIVECQIS